MKIRAIIVDDEDLDRELLRNLIATYCSSIAVLAEASSVADAIRHVGEYKPEVVFLDIHMPNANGFSLLERFPNKDFLIVFTTGHDDYGIPAVKAGAFDYLLKPIDVDELIATQQKLINVLRKPDKRTDPHVKIFHNGEHLLIKANDIVCLEASGSYVKIYQANGYTLLTSRNLKQVLSSLDAKFMQRVHRSFVVNTNHITGYHSGGNELTLHLTGGIEAKVARQYRAALKSMLG